MEYNIQHIKKRLNNMIYLNIMSFSMLSGCGNCSLPSHEEERYLKGLNNYTEYQHKPYNIFFTDSLYKKATPKYEVQIIDPYDFEGFKWIAKKRKKVIEAEVMANSIITSCNIIERLLMCEFQLDNPSLIMNLLHHNATKQASFMRKHLKISELYYNGEDVGEDEDPELHIQISSDNPDIESQFAVLHGFAALEQLENLNVFPMHFGHEALEEELSRLPFLCGNLIQDIKNQSTKELALVGLHLVGIYKKTNAFSQIVCKALEAISIELCSRTSASGEISRSRAEGEQCSLSTLTNCLNFQAQMTYMFNFKEAFSISKLIYKKVDSLWNSQHNIFTPRDSNKQSFTIKDIASIIGALFSYYNIAGYSHDENRLTEQITGFFETSFVKSCILNKQGCAMLQQSKLELHEVENDEKLWAPVFNKSFEYKLSKGKFYCEAEVFRADYVMRACMTISNSINN